MNTDRHGWEAFVTSVPFVVRKSAGERVPSSARIRVHSSSFVVKPRARPEDGGIWNHEWETSVVRFASRTVFDGVWPGR